MLTSVPPLARDLGEIVGQGNVQDAQQEQDLQDTASEALGACGERRVSGHRGEVRHRLRRLSVPPNSVNNLIEWVVCVCNQDRAAS
jgi:hypothetical protein